MAQAPFFKVYIENSEQRDISELIESFKYEDASEEDSLLRIDIKDDYALSLADDDDFASGTIIAFQFGFLGGEISELHRARVTDIKHKYRQKVTMTVVCLDLGTKVRKVSSQKIWKGKTSTQIAEEIAGKYGLNLVKDDTSKVWDNLPQGNRADFHFLEYLATRESSGNYVVYIRNNTMYFVKRGTETDSVLTFTYGDGDGTVLSFEPSVKESSQSGVSNKAVVARFDPYNGEYSAEVVDNDTETATGTLGSFKALYGEASADEKQTNTVKTKKRVAVTDGNGNVTGYRTETVTEEVQINKPVTDPTSNKDEAINLGNSRKKSATLKSLVAKLVVSGQPLLTPDKIITMRGVAKKHAGNWYITKVTHDVQQAGFLTTLDLNKNGTNRGSTKKSTSPTKRKEAQDSNQSVGADKVKNTVKVATIDGQGKIIK